MQFAATKPGSHWSFVQIKRSQPGKKKCPCRKKCSFITWWKALLGGPCLRAEQSIWIPTCFFEGANIIFTHLEMLNCYQCSKSPSLAGLSKCSDLLEQCQWASPPLSKSPSLQKKVASFMKQLVLRWNCETHTHTHAFTHTHTSHNVVFWLFLRLGTKLLSKISQWTRLSFIFKDRERQSEKGASLILLPFPLTAQTQNTHSEDGAEVEKVKKMRPCLFTGSVRNYCGAAAVLTP